MLAKNYNPLELESEWYAFWEQAGFFAPQGTGEPYCIMIPPPNVTGSLHMGHAFQQTLMDILIRYHRMQGQKTLWQVGTDHAGIATQMVVERQLLAEGQSRKALGREAFLEKVWEWKQESGGNITRQLRRMGASVDWSSERFTLDPDLSEAVTETFVRLFEEGLIYKGKRLVNWDPVLKTAVSDLEVESETEQGSLWYIRYPFKNQNAHLIVATTRPETLFGDVAVAVHPDDPRFSKWIGEEVQLPLTQRCIPIIADETVDPAFGTGCVKITPAHDFNDYAMGVRHKLPSINILTPEATLNESVPLPYQGLDRFVARKQVIRDLEALSLIEKIEPHTLNVPRGDKSGAILEPLLTDQWFIKIDSLAQPAIQAVKDGQIRFIPENWSKTYFEWMNNIQDWCISRQLWWGHRIPAWYDANGTVYVAESEQRVREKYQLSAEVSLKQDEDVLDTWFSSALWPFSTLGWPKDTERFQTFFPTQVLITGFDIIFFWVARMIMMSLKFTGQVPFQDIYIHGLIQDENGQKMSKTKGNVIDPIDLIDGIDLAALVQKRCSGMMQPQLAARIEKATRAQFPNGIESFGTDALRFTFASLATSNRHIRFDFARLEGYKHFCNKLWNAARYVLMNTHEQPISTDAPPLSLPDQWITSLWQHTKATLHKHLSQYRFDLASQTLFDFTWNEYCDWYLELSKPLLTAESAHPLALAGTRSTLVLIFEELLRALHPFMPYITEAIWQSVASVAKKEGPTIMLQPYPQFEQARCDASAETDIAWMKAVILSIRTIRGEMTISPSKKVPILFYSPNPLDTERMQQHQSLLQSLAKLSACTPLLETDHRPPAATALVGELEILIPLSDLIDKAAEQARLAREIVKLDKDLIKVQEKLQNEGFLKSAPAHLVDQEQTRLADLRSAKTKLEARLTEIAALP